MFLPLFLFPYTLFASPGVLSARQLNWPACQATLSCTFWDIESATMKARLDYMRYMQSARFISLNATDRFRAIEGVIEFFISQDIGKRGSWISHVDAGIIEGVQSGAAVVLKLPNAPAMSQAPANNNPGIALWKAYFEGQRRAGGYATRETHDHAWAKAEKAATEWAKVSVADKVANRAATKRELKWFNFTIIFRAIMLNESPARGLLQS